MSKPLALFCYAALCAASVALWFEYELRRAFRGVRVDCSASCTCEVTP